MSDLPMTPVQGILESLIRAGTSPGVFAVSGDEGADAGENTSQGAEMGSCFYLIIKL